MKNILKSPKKKINNSVQIFYTTEKGQIMLIDLPFSVAVLIISAIALTFIFQEFISSLL